MTTGKKQPPHTRATAEDENPLDFVLAPDPDPRVIIETELSTETGDWPPGWIYAEEITPPEKPGRAIRWAFRRMPGLMGMRGKTLHEAVRKMLADNGRPCLEGEISGKQIDRILKEMREQ